MNYDAAVLLDSPLGYYRMAELSGTTMVDSSGNGHNGTYTSTGVQLGGAGIGDGEPGAKFDGASGAASVALDLSGQNKVTLEFWMRVASWSSANNLLAAEFTTNYNTQAGGFIVDGNFTGATLDFGVSSAGASYNTGHFAQPSANAWHHYVVTLDRSVGTVFAAYVDGQPVVVTQDAGNTAVMGNNFANSTLYLMSRATTSLWQPGSMAKAAVYSGILSPAQVLKHYNAALNSAVTVAPPEAVLPRTLGPAGVGPTFFAGVPRVAVLPPFIPSVYSTIVLAEPSLLAYYRMDGALAGTVEYDATGNGHNGNYSQAASAGYAPAQGATRFDVDTAVQFAAARSGVLTLDTLGALGSSQGTSSFEFWIRTTTATQQFVLGTVNTGSKTAPRIELNTSTALGLLAGSTAILLRGETGSVNTIAFTANIYDGNWHHVVFTVSGGAASCTVRAYVDGASVGVSASSAQPFNYSSFANFQFNMAVGARNNVGSVGSYLDGTLDEVAFYTAALSAAQVFAHYQAGVGAASSPLVARLPLSLGPKAVGPMFFAAHPPPVSPVVASGPVANQSALAATLTFTGAQASSIVKLLAAVLTFTGARTLALAKLLAAAVLTFTGAATRRTAKLLAGSLAFAGAAAARTGKALTATVAFTGARLLAVSKALAAVLSLAGVQARASGKLLAATLTLTGSTARRLATLLASALTFTAAATKRTAKVLAAAVLAFAGGFVTQAVHFFTSSLAATLTFTGAQTRRMGKALSATASFTGAQSRRIGKALAAGVSAAGTLGRRIAKGLAGALSNVGGLIASLVSAAGSDARCKVSDGPVTPVALSELPLTAAALADGPTTPVAVTEKALTGCAVADGPTSPVALSDAPVNPG